ncbi:MAG: restriction endonuclease subunit S, partial [Synergistaceae bacterium]|nr:restriction endonuclease subunit S [Synergistaceae bacterium]
GTIDIAEADNVYIDKSLVPDRKLLRKNDIIVVASTASTKVIGRAGVSLEDYNNVAPGAFLLLLRPVGEVFAPYVAYYFQTTTYRNRVRDCARGGGIKNLRVSDITEASFPLPPLDEQKRIVQRLEAVLPEIDALNEHIHRLNHAREVFWRSLIQQETHSRDELLPEGWRWVKLGDVCTLINGRAFKPNEWSKEGLPIVRIQNLNDPNAEYHYFNDEVEKKYMLYGQELLFAWSASLGVYLWNGGKAVLNQHIFKVEVIESVTIKSYIGYTLQAQLTKIKNLSHGTTMKHIRKGTFEAVTIPLPPLDEQRRIVQRLDNFHNAIFQL